MVISSFCNELCPPTIIIIPGTRKQSPRLDIPPDSYSMENMWQKEVVITISKQEAIFLMTYENIWSTSTLAMTRLTPSMMDTQNTPTKLVEVNSPKTPILGSSENSAPPRKYPSTTRLTVTQRLQMSRIEKRGPLGISFLLCRKSRTRQPTIEHRSPRSRSHQSRERQQMLGIYPTGRLTESQSIISTPMATSSSPPISPSWHSCFLNILQMVTKKKFILRKQKLWERAVSLTASTPKATQMLQLREQTQILRMLLYLTSCQRVSSPLVAPFCSFMTKGMRKMDRMKVLQADLVMPSHQISTVIQQGTIALQSEHPISSSQRSNWLNSTDSRNQLLSSIRESPRRLNLFFLGEFSSELPSDIGLFKIWTVMKSGYDSLRSLRSC